MVAILLRSWFINMHIEGPSEKFSAYFLASKNSGKWQQWYFP